MIVPPAKEELPSVFWCWPGWLLTRYLTDSLRAMLHAPDRQAAAKWLPDSLWWRLANSQSRFASLSWRSVYVVVVVVVGQFESLFLFTLFVLIFFCWWRDSIWFMCYDLWGFLLTILKVFQKNCYCVYVLTRIFTKDCLVKKKSDTNTAMNCLKMWKVTWKVPCWYSKHRHLSVEHRIFKMESVNLIDTKMYQTIANMEYFITSWVLPATILH